MIKLSYKALYPLQFLLFFGLFLSIGILLFLSNNILKEIDRDELDDEQQAVLYWAIGYVAGAGLLALAFVVFLATRGNRFGVLSLLLIGSVALLMLGKSAIRKLRKSIREEVKSPAINQYLRWSDILSVVVAVLAVAFYVWNLMGQHSEGLSELMGYTRVPQIARPPRPAPPSEAQSERTVYGRVSKRSETDYQPLPIHSQYAPLKQKEPIVGQYQKSSGIEEYY